MTLLIILVLLVILDVVSYYWGVDSTDKIDSGEWMRRRQHDERRAGQREHGRCSAPLVGPFPQRPMRRQPVSSGITVKKPLR